MRDITINVLIVEDSKLYQAYLKRILEEDPCINVVGVAADGAEAVSLAERLMPDVITLDLNLPDRDGLDVLADLQMLTKAPIIAVSSSPTACERAIERGACDFIEKIQDTTAAAHSRFELLLKLKVKVNAQVRSSGATAETVRGSSVAARSVRVASEQAPSVEPSSSSDAASAYTNSCEVIALGASLGGTEATLQVLSLLPATMPGIVVVQHMPVGFTNAYAMRLDSFCKAEVREARSGDVVKPGVVLVARGGEHLTLRRAKGGLCVRSAAGEKAGGFCPSVDVLFESVARVAPGRSAGVILTGMGRDGARGLRAMHDGGAYTLGQDEESCAVFGMSAAAAKLGAVDELLPPEDIAARLMEYCGVNCA